MSNERRFGISANRIFTADDPRPNTTTSILSFTRHITHVFVNVRITTVFLWLAKSYLTLGIVFRSDSQVNLRQDWIRGESSSSISDFFFLVLSFVKSWFVKHVPVVSVGSRMYMHVWFCFCFWVSAVAQEGAGDLIIYTRYYSAERHHVTERVRYARRDHESGWMNPWNMMNPLLGMSPWWGRGRDPGWEGVALLLGLIWCLPHVSQTHGRVEAVEQREWQRQVWK